MSAAQRQIPCSTSYEFTGYERDAETAYGTSAGNDYAFARYYNSRLGRFMSGDPLGGDVTDPQNLNRYAYVLNNPLKFVDPSGLCDRYDPHAFGGRGGFVYSGPGDCSDPNFSDSAGAAFSTFPGENIVETPSRYRGWRYRCHYLHNCTPPRPTHRRPQQPQAPTWLLQTKVFLSALGNNFINEFKPNGCFTQFADELVTGQSADASPPGAGPEDVIRSTGQAAAATYASGQGLLYPLKSSIYRGILGLTETAAGIVTLAPLDYEAGKAFVHEMQSLGAGTCQ